MRGRSTFWGEQIVVSERQIELAINMNAYRRKHNMSQIEMAHICTLYGEPHGVKFSPSEISNYESLKFAPRLPKFQILCNVLDMKK